MYQSLSRSLKINLELKNEGIKFVRIRGSKKENDWKQYLEKRHFIHVNIVHIHRMEKCILEDTHEDTLVKHPISANFARKCSALALHYLLIHEEGT